LLYFGHIISLVTAYVVIALLTVWSTLLDLAQQLRSTEIRSAIARLGFETVPSGIDRCSELYITGLRRIISRWCKFQSKLHRAGVGAAQPEIGKTASVSKMPMIAPVPPIMATLRLQRLNITGV